MRVMVAKIVFPAVAHRKEIVLHQVNAVHISSTFKQLTGTAEIMLPRKVKYFDRFNVKTVFRREDPVIISLGYDGTYQEKFSGYVMSVSADIPILIRCEDEMFKVKRLPVNFSAAETTLEKLLKAICPGYAVDALENVPLGGVRLSQQSVGQVLTKLQQDFGLYSYMKGKTLVCGKYYAANSSVPVVNFNLERNVVSNALTYRSKEDILLKIKGISLLRDGKKLEFEIGEDGGDSLSLSYYNITAEAELQKMVKQDYQKRLVDGFDGSLTAFGRPDVQHGYKGKLSSLVYPDRNGIYYIEGVDTHFDDGGYRQEIKFGDKA